MREGLAVGGLLITVGAIGYDMGARSCYQASDLVAGVVEVAGVLGLVAGLVAGVIIGIIGWALYQATVQGPLP